MFTRTRTKIVGTVGYLAPEVMACVCVCVHEIEQIE